MAEGDEVAKYRDIAELGRGGMGEVSLCVATGMGGFSKLLVVKRLRTDLAEDPELVDMFIREARLAARLHHPNIVQTNDVGTEGKRHYMAMEYLDGQSLHSVLARCRERASLMPLPMHLRVLSEILAGLHYAHELTDTDGTPLRIIHRDATPHNVFITYDGQVKLVDFGIAKIASVGGQHTTTGVLKGKTQYMSPEQIEVKTGEPKPDRRADIFSVGVMMWEAVTGKRMWKGRSEPQIISLLMNNAIPRAREHAPDMPKRLEEILDKSLAKNPNERYATADAMLSDIDAYLDSLGDRTTARDVGRYVATQFADTRAEIRGVIEKQLSLVRAMPSTPVLDLSDQPSQLRRVDEGESASKIVVAREAAKTPPPANGRAILVVGGVLVGAAVAGFLLVKATARPETPASASGSPSTPIVPMVASTASQPSASASTPKAIAIPASVTPPANEYVKLAIECVPATAKLTLDGAELTSCPYSGRYVRDNAAHKLMVEAPGFVNKTQWVTFEGAEVTVRAVLVPLGKLGAMPSSTAKVEPSVTVAPPVPTPSATETAAPEPSWKPKPKLPIDKDDPWDALPK